MSLEGGGGGCGGQGQRFKAVNGFQVTDITQWASHSAPQLDKVEGTGWSQAVWNLQVSGNGSSPLSSKQARYVCFTVPGNVVCTVVDGRQAVHHSRGRCSGAC